MTRIKKIKGVYPATIAQAVKDVNFKKSGGAVMTQSEINKTMRDDIIGYTIAQKALLQIAVMYLLPSWQPDTLYIKDSIVRVGGRVYKALKDTTESPVSLIDNGSGEPLETAPWTVLIADDVNDGNYAHLDLDNLSSASLTEQFEQLRDALNQRCDNYESSMQEAFVRYGEYLQTAYNDKEAGIEAAYNAKLAEIDAQYSEALAEQKAINAAQQKQLQEVKAMMEEMQRYTFMITDYDNSK